MKEGAGEDPFAEDDQSAPGETAADDAPRSEPVGDRSSQSGHSSGSGQAGSQQTMSIPYKLRRNGVKDGRDRVPLFLQPETKRGEREARRTLEDRIDDDVSLTDLREALVRTGLEHLDEVEGQLEEWGYGMTFDE